MADVLGEFEVSIAHTRYFGQALKVYGRAGQPCPTCGRTLKTAVIGQRASVWCPDCQR